MTPEPSPDLSLRHLRTFQAVLETGRLTAAGDLVSRSASAVSRSIAILEKEFREPLLVRAQTGLSATAAGEAVAARCQIIRHELRSCFDLLSRSHKVDVRPKAAFFEMLTDTTHLRALVAVHDFKSVQRAAHYLAVSQPAISYSIKLIENDISVALFSRLPNGMIPTPAGVSLAVHVRRILAELSKMVDDVRSVEGRSFGIACIGGLAYSRTALLPDAIKLALSRYPGIRLRTVEGPIETLLAELHSGKIDLVICAYPDRSLLDGIDVDPITSDPMGLFVWKDHPLAEQRALRLKDLAAYPFILPPAGSITRILLERFFRDDGGIVPTGRTETSSYSMVRNLLLGTEHIAFRSLREFDPRATGDDIVALDMSVALPTRKICLLQRHGVRHTAAVRDFLEVVREVAGDGSRTMTPPGSRYGL